MKERFGGIDRLYGDIDVARLRRRRRPVDDAGILVDRHAGGRRGQQVGQPRHAFVGGLDVVGVGDEQFHRFIRRCAPHRVGVTAARADIGEDPFLVPGFLVDVFRHGAAQPFEALRQARAAGHEQRQRVLHVVIRLREEGDIIRAVEPTRGAVAYEGQCEQGAALRVRCRE